MENATLMEYIPHEIVAGWSDDGENIKYLDLDKIDEVSECGIDDLFLEYFIIDCAHTSNETEESLFSLTRECINRLKNGDTKVLEEEKHRWAFLIASQYFLYPFSPGGIEIYMKRNSDKIRKAESEEALMELASKEYERTRKLSERYHSEFISIVTGMYLWDLKTTLLYAPETSSFALGEAPLVMMNYFNNTDTYFNPFSYHGVILILPITPKMAVCFYDSEVYKVKKTEGRALLADEDVDVINTFIAEYSTKVLFSRNEKNDENYIRSLLKDEEKVKRVADYNISIFRFLASSLDIESGSLREYPDALMHYDDEHDEDDDDKYLSDRTDFALNLLDTFFDE